MKIFVENFCPTILFIIGLLLIYSGISGIIKEILKKRGMLKREIVIVGLGVAIIIMLNFYKKCNISMIYNFINYMAVYFAIAFIIFCILSLIDNIKPIRDDYKAIIVLGGILVNGNQLTKALTKRLKLVEKLYNNQKIKPKIILSGGKVRKETITEAVAMRDFLLKQGIPENDIIMEDKSKNTLENFKYSKQILNQINIHKKIAFVSNNFHILRAKIYAKKSKVNATGIGANVSWYYFPEAFIKEYLAIIILYKKILLIYITIAIIIAIIGG